MSKEQFPWKTAIVGAVAVIIAAFALFAFLSAKGDVKSTAEQAVDLLGHAMNQAPEIAEKFLAGSITHTFRESIASIEGNSGDILEVAIIRANETFRREDEKILASRFSLGTTTAEIQAPVTFRYHIRLNDEWRLASQSNVCLVLAPPLRPSLPPAIDTAEMSKMSESGWARFDKHEVLTALEKEMTPILQERAGDAAHLELAREQSRLSVASFVRAWLLKEDHWRTNRFTSIVVKFADEVGEEPAFENLPYNDAPATLTLSSRSTL